MAVKSISVAPQYVSFYVAGSRDVDVPIAYGADGVFGTGECLVVTCLYWNDGETRITLGSFDELPPKSEPARFDGIIDTPQRKVLLFDVNMPEILSMNVPDTQTRLRIWTNHPTEPDDVVIALG